MFRCLLVVTITAAWLLTSSRSSGGQPTNAKEFLNLYSIKQADLINYYIDLQIQAEYTKRETLHSDASVIENLLFSRNQNCNMIEIEHNKRSRDHDAGDIGVLCLNNSYGFALSKKEKDDGFRLAQLFEHHQLEKIDLQLRTHGRFFFSPYCMSESNAIKLLTSPANEITKISYSTENAARIAKIEWVVSAKPWTGGWIKFLPEQSWAIAAYGWGSKKTHSEQYRCSIEYMNQTDKIPVLKSAKYWTNTQDNLERMIEDYSVKAHKKLLFTDSIFMLSAFGLREPVTETPPPPNRNFLWITLGAVGAFIVGLLVRRKVKSLEAKAS